MSDDLDSDVDHLPQPARARLPVLGLGWDFPVRWRLIADGRVVAASSDEDAVCRSIALVLGTVRGERAMRPTFGSRLQDFVFSPNTPATRTAVEYEVREALLRDEPRIEVLDVVATQSGRPPDILLIDIALRVRGTDNRFNMVYPFYLERTHRPEGQP